ncbi:MAG: UDP-N-acetylmuramate--L-alanine ligase [Sphingobacteriaceae bacterium]|nr:UDP-N-acetylmuramate--L-alanine ligase [Cytophagaceae bacterium]
MNFKQLRNIYFLGIGGIGMSAIARWFNVNGYRVAGYDRTPTPLTEALQAEGIAIHFDDAISQIPAEFVQHKDATLVVRTPAVPADHAEWNFLEKEDFQILKRSQVLGLLAQNMFLIAVAGTHGKTTTSSMVAHVLRHAGRNCTAFLGGITQNYGTNFLLNEETTDLRSVLCVVEADEFDRSFLTLFPDVAIVTSTDADHLDIYGDGAQVLDSFGKFVNQIKPEGQLFQRKGLSLASKTSATVREYGLDEGEFAAQNVRISDACFVFDIQHPDGVCEGISLQLPGFHNVENATAAFAACRAVGLSPEEIRAGLDTYLGVKRRFEYHVRQPDRVYIDDYAHHPTEIEAFLKSVRALYPGRKLTAVFQPHLFSRTRDFLDGFAEALGLADELLLLDIYPAREQPISGVTSELLLGKVPLERKQIYTKAGVLEYIRANPAEVLVTIGAGDIDQLIVPLREMLRRE